MISNGMPSSRQASSLSTASWILLEVKQLMTGAMKGHEEVLTYVRVVG